MVDGKGFSLIGSGARNEFYLSHTVNVFSNTVITTVEYLHLQDTIKISVVETGDYGFIRMVVPPSLMDVSNMSLLINHGTSEAICFDKNLHNNGTHEWIYVSFRPHTYEVIVVPEFPSLITSLLIASLLAAAAAKWKMKVELAAT